MRPDIHTPTQVAYGTQKIERSKGDQEDRARIHSTYFQQYHEACGSYQKDQCRTGTPLSGAYPSITRK